MDRSPARPTPEVLRAWQGLLVAHSVLTRRMAEELTAERDLPLAWYEAILHLERAPDRRLRMQELGTAMVVSKSNTTRLVDRLVRAGLVRRVPCPQDRRATWVTATAAGRAAFRRAAPVHLRGIAEHFGAHVTHDEARVLADVFERITAAVGGESPGQASRRAR